MGLMNMYTCGDCGAGNSAMKGVGMRGRNTTEFDCPSCRHTLEIDRSADDWQWHVVWCPECTHAFVPYHADYNPGLSFEEAARAYAEKFGPRVFATKPEEGDDGRRRNGETKPVDNAGFMPHPTQGLRPCWQCKGTDLRLSGFGCWD